MSVFFQQPGNQKEPQAARQNRSNAENPDIQTDNAAGNSYHLIGKRRNAGPEDNPGPPLMIISLKCLKLAKIAVKIQNRLGDQIKEINADNISEIPAENTSHRCHPGNFPCLFRGRQNHRNQHNVRRNRKKRTLNKRNCKQPIQSRLPRRQINHIIIAFCRKTMPNAAYCTNHQTCPHVVFLPTYQTSLNIYLIKRSKLFKSCIFLKGIINGCFKRSRACSHLSSGMPRQTAFGRFLLRYNSAASRS